MSKPCTRAGCVRAVTWTVGDYPSCGVHIAVVAEQKKLVRCELVRVHVPKSTRRQQVLRAARYARRG